jgi:peptidoglycan hydrolase-like amidase
VRITDDWRCNPYTTYTVKTIDFKDYIRHVLPNEWLPGWDSEALRAGAIATKMYAWYWISQGGKWRPDADVYDSTCDQVYDPEYERVSTTVL